jgi:hypothetical protein
MKRKGIIKTVVLSALVVFISGFAWAQQAETPADNMQIIREKLQADKKLLVADNMNLTDKEAKAFWPVYDSYQKDLIKLNDRVIKNISDYEINVDKMTDDVAKKLIKEYLAIESDRLKLRQSYLPKFEKVLPYKKVMRYYQLENKVYAIVMYEAAKKIPLVD